MANITINNTCPFCRKTHSVEVDYHSYISWQNGTLIQRAMPELTPTEREQLISGICPKCQESIFGSDEDEPADIDSDEDEDYEPADIDSDMGYDPYSGCITDDC